MRWHRLVGVVMSVAWFAAGCVGQAPPEPKPQPQAPAPRTKFRPMGQCVDPPAPVDPDLEVIDAMGVVKLTADGFIDLEPQQRILAYHLSRAAVAGDALAYRVIGIKTLAEELALHRRAMPEGLREKVETFARRAFVHKGLIDRWTGDPLPMPLEQAELRQALVLAINDGAKLPGAGSEAEVDAYLESMRPLLFDASAKPKGENAAPHEASRRQMATSLREAAKVANGQQRVSIEQLATYVEKGSDAAWEAHAKAGAMSAPVAASVTVSTTQHSFLGAVFLEEKAVQSSLVGIAPVLARGRPMRAGIPLTLTGGVGFATPAVLVVEGPSGPGQAWVLQQVLDAFERVNTRAMTGGFLSPEDAVRRCVPRAYRARAILSGAFRAASGPRGEAMGVVRLALADSEAIIAVRDAKTAEVLLQDGDCASVFDAMIPAQLLFDLRTVRSGTAIREPSLAAANLLVRYAATKGAVTESMEQGRLLLRIGDREAWRKAVEALQAELRAIVDSGDEARASRLVNEYGSTLVGRWRDASVKRSEGMPLRLVFVTPRLKAIHDGDGNVSDATVADSHSIIETALIDAGKMEMY